MGKSFAAKAQGSVRARPIQARPGQTPLLAGPVPPPAKGRFPKPKQVPKRVPRPPAGPPPRVPRPPAAPPPEHLLKDKASEPASEPASQPAKRLRPWDVQAGVEKAERAEARAEALWAKALEAEAARPRRADAEFAEAEEGRGLGRGPLGQGRGDRPGGRGPEEGQPREGSGGGRPGSRPQQTIAAAVNACAMRTQKVRSFSAAHCA